MPGAPVTIPTNMPKRAMLALLALGTPRVMLATASYTPDQDAHIFASSITNEAAGTGYTANGVILNNVVVNIDATTNKATMDADDWLPAGLSVASCRWGNVIVWTGALNTSPILAWVDLSLGAGGNVPCTGIVWDAAGIIPAVVA